MFTSVPYGYVPEPVTVVWLSPVKVTVYVSIADAALNVMSLVTVIVLVAFVSPSLHAVKW